MDETTSLGCLTMEMPSECWTNIFSFLPLKDTLNFGATSLSCMKELLPELCRRRNFMNQRFAYRRHWKANKTMTTTTTSSGGSSVEVPEVSARYIALWDEVKPLTSSADENDASSTCDWVAMPSVCERVEQLCRRMPISHGLCETVIALRQALREDIDEKIITSVRFIFSDMFELYHKLLRAHILHAKILWDTIYSNPFKCTNPWMTCEERDTVSLDQYIGDVYALTFLMSFSDLRIVEGGPTNAACVKILRHERHSVSEASQCYRQWVYMHSSVLRGKIFTRDERGQLGIPSELCELSEMIPNDFYVSESFMASEMTLTFYSFGRLGPAFRGRDDIQVRDLPGRCLFAFFITDNVRFRGETTRTAMEWLCLVHAQADKVRPMTVRPPSIRIGPPHAIHI